MSLSFLLLLVVTFYWVEGRNVSVLAWMEFVFAKYYAIKGRDFRNFVEGGLVDFELGVFHRFSSNLNLLT